MSEPGDLPNNAPLSADVKFSSDDMRVECELERFAKQRVANKSSYPMLSRIAGETSDEEFLEVAGLDKSARERIDYDMLQLG